MQTRYNIDPKYKKSTYEKEEWRNKLKNGKNVVIHIITFYRYGYFSANLSIDEADEIKNKEYEEIVLNNYDDFEMHELNDGCSLEIVIENEYKYSEDEIKEINCLIYCDKGETCGYESGEGNTFDICVLEDNGWESYECEYGIIGGCFIESEP